MKYYIVLLFSTGLMAFDGDEVPDIDDASTVAAIQEDGWMLIRDARQIGSDMVKLGVDVICYVGHRVSSVETLVIDAAADTVFRQVTCLANLIKQLEKTNPVNAAIVRDTGKVLTFGYKLPFNASVDLSGRKYDDSDVYAQVSKVGIKAVGIAALKLTIGLDEQLGVFVVNTAGDVFSQGILDAGKEWRNSSQNVSFAVALSNSYEKALLSGTTSIPVKSAISAAIGKLLLYSGVIEMSGKGVAVLVAYLPIGQAYQTKVRPASQTFVQSAVKSIFLTTGAKVAIDASKSVREKYLEPILVTALSYPKLLTTTLSGALGYYYFFRKPNKLPVQ